MTTIEQNLTQLVQDRDDLVTNLTTKGITGLTGDETFTELVPEVLNISGGGSGHDWSAIGYSGEPQVIQDGYDYAVQIKNNWDSSVTNYQNKFNNDTNLIYMPLVDTSNGTNFNSMFKDCYALTTAPQLDTSNGTNFNSMFSGCKLITTAPQLDTSKGTNFAYMFSNCTKLTTAPQLNTSKGEILENMFSGCKLITTIPQYDTSKSFGLSYMLSGCTSLITVPQLDASSVTSIASVFFNVSSMTTFGGFKDLGKAYLTTRAANYTNYTLTLSSSNNLTHDSLMNVINNLYDIASAGVQTQRLVLGSTNLAKLSSAEIAIATNKGWAVS